MNAFDSVERLLALAKSHEELRVSHSAVRARRYIASPGDFDRLLWLLIANAMCVGARAVIKETMP